MVSSRKIDACQAVVAEIEAAHGAGRAIAIAASISSKPDLERLIAETSQTLGPVDILVSNAASNPYYGPLGGIKGSPVIGAYNVSKAADMQLARNLAVEWGEHNIRVNCIAPGLIKTDFARALWENPKTAKAVEQGTPLRRIGDPDDIAGAAVYLASTAGRYMTGQTIVVDGGVTITGGVLG